MIGNSCLFTWAIYISDKICLLMWALDVHTRSCRYNAIEEAYVNAQQMRRIRIKSVETQRECFNGSDKRH